MRRRKSPEEQAAKWLEDVIAAQHRKLFDFVFSQAPYLDRLEREAVVAYAFEQLWRAKNGIDEKKKLEFADDALVTAWLRATATNKIVGDSRLAYKKRVQLGEENVIELRAVTADFSDDVTKEIADSQLLTEALRELTMEERQIFAAWCYYVVFDVTSSKTKVQDAAAALFVSRNTFPKRIEKILAKLRRIVDELRQVDDDNQERGQR